MLILPPGSHFNVAVRWCDSYWARQWLTAVPSDPDHRHLQHGVDLRLFQRHVPDRRGQGARTASVVLGVRRHPRFRVMIALAISGVWRERRWRWRFPGDRPGLFLWPPCTFGDQVRRPAGLHMASDGGLAGDGRMPLCVGPGLDPGRRPARLSNLEDLLTRCRSRLV